LRCIGGQGARRHEANARPDRETRVAHGRHVDGQSVPDGCRTDGTPFPAPPRCATHHPGPLASPSTEWCAARVPLFRHAGLGFPPIYAFSDRAYISLKRFLCSSLFY